MSKRNLTYLSLEERDKRLACMRAIQLGLSLSHYVARLVRQDAEQAGLLDLVVDGTDGEGAGHGDQ